MYIECSNRNNIINKAGSSKPDGGSSLAAFIYSLFPEISEVADNTGLLLTVNQLVTGNQIFGL
jgi:hypothetical protein